MLLNRMLIHQTYTQYHRHGAKTHCLLNQWHHFSYHHRSFDGTNKTMFDSHPIGCCCSFCYCNQRMTNEGKNRRFHQYYYIDQLHRPTCTNCTNKNLPRIRIQIIFLRKGFKMQVTGQTFAPSATIAASQGADRVRFQYIPSGFRHAHVSANFPFVATDGQSVGDLALVAHDEVQLLQQSFFQ